MSKAVGLDSYIQFLKGDAFELELGETCVDILWYDFGVDSRIREFVSSAWSSLRPAGGFLLCHSTLTNLNTREWLDSATLFRLRGPACDLVASYYATPH